MKTLASREQGQGFIEYLLILALVVIVGLVFGKAVIKTVTNLLNSYGPYIGVTVEEDTTEENTNQPISIVDVLASAGLIGYTIFILRYVNRLNNIRGRWRK